MTIDDEQMLALYRRNWISSLGRSADTVDHYLREIAVLRTQLHGPLADADRLTLEAFIVDRTERSAHTGRWAFRAVRSVYAWLADRDVIGENPAAKLKGPKEPKNPTPTTATADAVEKLLSSIPRDRLATRDRAIISTLWGTGMRRGELCRMQLHHLDLDAQTLLIPITKTGRPRTIPLQTAVIDALVPWLEQRIAWKVDLDHVWLARSRGKTTAMSPNAVRLMMERRRRTAGVHLSPHSFRRGAAAHFLRSGVSQVSVESVFGWVNGSPMCAQYVRAVASELSHDEVRRIFG